jgi:hypothetical protein
MSRDTKRIEALEKTVAYLNKRVFEHDAYMTCTAFNENAAKERDRFHKIEKRIEKLEAAQPTAPIRHERQHYTVDGSKCKLEWDAELLEKQGVKCDTCAFACKYWFCMGGKPCPCYTRKTEQQPTAVCGNKGKFDDCPYNCAEDAVKQPTARDMNETEFHVYDVVLFEENFGSAKFVVREIKTDNQFCYDCCGTTRTMDASEVILYRRTNK